MELLLIRHAIAMEREDFAASARPDSERPLTDEGRTKMIEAAAGLASVVETIALLAASPFTRARETADIVALAFPGVRREETPALEPDESPITFARWIAAHATAAESGVVAAVGHEPHLGDMAAWLIAGEADDAISFKKGGACLIEINETPRRASGTLRWLLTPGQLRSWR